MIIRDLFQDLEQNENKLSTGQIDFVKSLKRYYHKARTLSEKQLQVLREMKKRRD